MEDPEIRQQAAQWVDSLENRWRVVMMQDRAKRDVKTGDWEQLPVKIKRFVEGIPWAQMKYVIDELVRRAPYSGIIANGIQLGGVYRPTVTTWTRDAQMNTNARGDATYTLVQDLVEEGSLDTFDAVEAKNCVSEVLTTYGFDEPSFPEIPDPEQGVSYQLGLNRAEDGTFNYQLKKITAITQHTPEKVVKDDATSVVTSETWRNLYTDEDGKYIDNNGVALDIPGAGIGPDGLVTIEGYQKNEDCTYNLVINRTKVKETVNEFSSTHSIYQGQHSVSSTGNTEPLPDAPDASDGKIILHQSTKGPDGSYTNTKRSTIEREVLDADVSVRVGRRGKFVSVTNRNQVAPADMSGVQLGGSVQTKKTDGGLYDNSVQTFSRGDTVKAGVQCHDDKFSHVDETTTGGVAALPTGHVSGGSGGYIVERAATLDDDGAIVQVDKTTKEKNVDSAVEAWTVTPYGVQHTVVHKSRPVNKKGKEPEFSVSTIGTSVKNTVTAGGLVDVEESVLIDPKDPVRTSTGCQKVTGTHVDSSTETGGDATLDTHVEEAGGGVHRKVEVSVNQYGTVTTQETVTTELPVEDRRVSYTRTARGLVEQHDSEHMAAPLDAPEKPGGRVVNELTPGGLYNTTQIIVTPSETPDSSSCEANLYQHQHTSVAISAEGVPDESDVSPVVMGSHQYQQKRSDVDESGLTRTQVTTTKELPVSESDVTLSMTRHGLVKQVRNRNMDAPLRAPTKVGHSVRNVKTPGGSYDTEYSELGPPSKDKIAVSCAKTIEKHEHSETTAATKLPEDDVQSPAGGVYYTRRSYIDSDGYVQTDLTKTEEIEVKDYKVSKSKTKFTDSDEVTTAQTDQPPSDSGFNIGTIVTADSQKTSGGKYTTRVSTRTAKFVWWENNFSSDFTEEYEIKFRNATEEESKDLWNNKFLKGSKSLLMPYIGFGGVFTFATDRSPTSINVTPVRDLNEYGLYDGSYKVRATWDARRRGKDALLTSTFKCDCAYGWWDISFSDSDIGTKETPTSPSGLSKVTSYYRIREIQKVHRTYYHGIGWKRFLTSVFGNGSIVTSWADGGGNFAKGPSNKTNHGSLFNGSHISFSVTTGEVSAVIVDEIKKGRFITSAPEKTGLGVNYTKVYDEELTIDNIWRGQ